MAYRWRVARRPARFRGGRKRWMFALLCTMIILFGLVYMIEQKIKPMLLTFVKTELKKAAQEAVTHGVKQVAAEQDVEELMQIEKDHEGKITMVKINSHLQAKLYSQVADGIQKQLKKLSDHNVELSLGELLQSPFLSDYGPSIPVQLWPKGASKISLVPKMESAGINTVMVSLTLKVHSELGVIVPFSKESTVVDISYPLGEMMMVGEVPEYYFYSSQGEVKALPTLPVPQK